MNSFNSLILLWLLNYLAHSFVLLGAMALCQKFGILKQRKLLESLWRFALFAGLFSASLHITLSSNYQDSIVSPAPASIALLDNVPVRTVAAAEQSETGTRSDAHLTQASERSLSSTSMQALDRPSSSSVNLTLVEQKYIEVSAAVNSLISALLITWLLYSLFVICKIALSVMHLNRLAATMPVLDRADLRSLLSSRLPHRHAQIRLRQSSKWHSPFVCPDNTICVPAWALTQENLALCNAMLNHEIQHITRRDNWWRIAQQIMCGVFFFQILNRVATKQLNLLAEIDCDQTAQQASETNAMAEALLSCAEISLSDKLPAMAIPMAQASSFVQRINLLLDEDPMRKSQEVTYKGKFISISIVAISGLAAMSFSMPTIAFVESANDISKLPGAYAVNVGEADSTSRLQRNETSIVEAGKYSTDYPPEDEQGAEKIQQNGQQKMDTEKLVEAGLSATSNAKAMDHNQGNTPPQATTNSNPGLALLTLESAKRAFDNRDYVQAFALYGDLATAGNVEAQALKGEMLWYGEGTNSDPLAASYWLKKAAAQGHLKAQKYLDMFADRARRKNEITYYTHQFDGGQYRWTEATCQQPSFSSNQVSRESVQSLTKQVNDHVSCFNNYLSTLKQLLQSDVQLPEDLRLIMRAEEIAQAASRQRSVFRQMATQARQSTERVIVQFENWDKELVREIYRNNLAVEVLKKSMDAIEWRNIEAQKASPSIVSTYQPMPQHKEGQ